MSNFKQPTKQSTPTPASCTEAIFDSAVTDLTKHYTKVLTPTIMITARKGAYATVINSTYKSLPLDQVLGTDNAKVVTEMVLANISRTISTIK